MYKKTLWVVMLAVLCSIVFAENENYNMTFLNTSNGVTDVLDGVNNMTDGLYAGMILLILFVIVFVAMKKYDTDVVLLVDSFICSIIAVLFFVKQWIGIEILVIPIVLLVIALFYKVANG